MNTRKIYLTMLMSLMCTTWGLCTQATDLSKRYRDLPVTIEQATPPDIPDRQVLLTDFGGCGDGTTLNTDAFAKAIDNLSQRGGGHLIVPPGIYLTGPIVLKSHIDLHVERDALILFSGDHALYPVMEPDAGTSGRRHQPLISATYSHDISITGQGIIDGNGEAWRPMKRFKTSDAEWKSLLQRPGVADTLQGIWYPLHPEAEVPLAPDWKQIEKEARSRPRMIRFLACDRVMLEDIVVQHSPSFHVNLILCHHIVCRNISVRCPWNAQNGDGIDLSSCTHALVADCTVDVGDDAICLKSGVGETGRRRGPCAHILVEGCTVFHGHGGFVIGSDTSGGMNHVVVRRCRFTDTDMGLRFKSRRGSGGPVEHIYAYDILMHRIRQEAIGIDCYYQQSQPTEQSFTGDTIVADQRDSPRFRRIHISRIRCSSAGQAIAFYGLPESRVQDIRIDDSVIRSVRGMTLYGANHIRLERVVLHTDHTPLYDFHHSHEISINSHQIIQ